MSYSADDLVNALKAVDIEDGDVVFSHSNVGFWGLMHGVSSSNEQLSRILAAVLAVIGDAGTLIVPTFTYSFGSEQLDKIFDVRHTPSKMGVFAEYLRQHPQAMRSSDPMFSVAAIGKDAEHLTQGVSNFCFGKGSFWERFHHANGKILNFNFDAGSTFIHYVEKALKVPYRRDRIFRGHTVLADGSKQASEVVFFCCDSNDLASTAQFERFDSIARAHGCARIARVGRGTVLTISSKDTYQLIEAHLVEAPLLLTRGQLPPPKRICP